MAGHVDPHAHATLSRLGLIRLGLAHPTEHWYCNVVPYDATLAPCSAGYVNLSRVSLRPWREGRILVGQAPMPHAVGKFWTAVWENDVGVVAALATPMECEGMDYTQPRGDASSIRWNVDSEEHDDARHVRRRVIRLQRPGEQDRVVAHLLMTSWPNYGVPTVEDLASFVRMVDHEMSKSATSGKNLLVHCKGGVGRSGTFVTALHAWKTGQDVDDTVRVLRTERHPWCVETSEQYALIPHVLLKLVEQLA